jgi:chromosome segregation ATPase
MCETQNFQCNNFISLLQENQRLCGFYGQIEYEVHEEKQRQLDEAAGNEILTRKTRLKEFIEQLNEKLALFKLMATDLGRELIALQDEIPNMENATQIQEKRLEDFKWEIFKMEREVNIRVHEMRENFLKKFNELKDYEENVTENERLSKNLNQKAAEYEQELNAKKMELKIFMCRIERLKTVSNSVPDEIIEKLQQNHEKLLKKRNKTNMSISCAKENIMKTQTEIDVVRKVIRSTLKVHKHYNEWSVDREKKKPLQYLLK